MTAGSLVSMRDCFIVDDHNKCPVPNQLYLQSPIRPVTLTYLPARFI